MSFQVSNCFPSSVWYCYTLPHTRIYLKSIATSLSRCYFYLTWLTYSVTGRHQTDWIKQGCGQVSRPNGQTTLQDARPDILRYPIERGTSKNWGNFLGGEQKAKKRRYLFWEDIKMLSFFLRRASQATWYLSRKAIRGGPSIIFLCLSLFLCGKSMEEGQLPCPSLVTLAEKERELFYGDRNGRRWWEKRKGKTIRAISADRTFMAILILVPSLKRKRNDSLAYLSLARKRKNPDQ